MAQTNKETFLVFGLLSVLLLIQKGGAFEFKVGGSNGWTVPADSNAAIYNQWAEKNRFQIGDTLLFVYPSGQDSVLRVTKDDYTNCNTGSPLQKFSDGHSVYKFNQSGPHYFISGVPQHCHQNEKLVVVVMADRTYNGTVSSPPPSPSAVPPPSPAPAGEESPSPPSPAPSEESSPPSPSAQAPSEESSPPKKNSGSSMVASVTGTAAVFVASLLVLAN